MDGGERVGIELRRRAAVLAGDERAWREWYDATYDDLRAYAHWRCASLHQIADEVVQDTWLTAVRRARDFDPRKGSFRSWLFGIAANVVLLGISREGNSDPVGHFRPQLGVATATYGREVKSVPRAKARPAEKRSWSAGDATSLSGSSGGLTTVRQHEPGETDDD